MAQLNEADGVRVVLSPAQLAAVLSGQSISPTEMLSNRLWGGLQVVGGVLEMVGASALCVMPEPTMLSKAGCIAFGVHGSDTAATGIRQLWTGQDTATLVQQGTTKLAETLKAPSEMANNIGLSVDIGVSFGIAGMVKAMRVSHVTMGEIYLKWHEAEKGSRIGGHTIRKHVQRTEEQLRERLRLEPRRDIVSSFHNLRTAELAISKVMRAEAARIQSWAQSSNNRIPLTLIRRVPGDIGYGITRKTGELTKMNEVTVVLKHEAYNGMPYYILTAYVG
jgi:hypothetical protein